MIAVLEGRAGPLVDGRPYTEPDLIQELEEYHTAAVEAHRAHARLGTPLPVVARPGPAVVPGEVVTGEVLPESDAAWSTDS